MTAPEIMNIIDEIRDDKTHGASELARRAVEVLKIAAQCSRAPGSEELLAEQLEIGRQLMEARPTIAPIFNMVKNLMDIISFGTQGLELDSARLLVISEADKIINGSLKAADQIARHTLELISAGDVIMTHSYSSTVITALKVAFAKYTDIKVVATRSGPGRTGEIIAQQLASEGMSITFIDDTAVGLYMNKVKKVLVGADRICADAKVVNGIGTYPIAIAAEKAGVPFYVLCETLKFDPRTRGEDVDLEEKEPSELASPGILRSKVTVKNPHFELTPMEVVSGVVTENGLLKPVDVTRHLKRMSR